MFRSITDARQIELKSGQLSINPRSAENVFVASTRKA